MPSPALAQLELLLRARKLDHTLASQPSFHAETAASFAPSASAALKGGPASLWLPRGQISEIVGSRSSGRQTTLVSWLAAATARGELTALVDPLDMFDPSSADACGVDLARLLWVRGRALGSDRVSLPREAGDLRVQVEQAVKAVNLILQASGFGLVALDLGEVPVSVIGRLPLTTWRRLHRVIAGGETACVVVAGEPVARSVGGVTVALEAPNKERPGPTRNFTTENTEGTENQILKTSVSPVTSVVKDILPVAGSRRPAGGLHHVRVFPNRQIEGRLVHARGMRTERFTLSLNAEVCSACQTF